MRDDIITHGEVREMGATIHIKNAMLHKGLKSGAVAKLIGKDTQNFYNQLNRDAMKFSEVEMIADVMGCDVMLVDRETGEAY